MDRRYVTSFLLSSLLLLVFLFPSSLALTIHLVPHSHDDVGYEKTMEEYYYGANQTIRAAAVQYTLDSVMPVLAANRNRRFTQVEMAFFSTWWNEQDQEMQDLVRKLVQNGQLEFANAGYVMHDEACAYYTDMIDQMTLGHLFLSTTFPGYVPRTAWQIDPFGHSSTQAGLLGAYAGFDSLYICRIDYEDKFQRMFTKAMEISWDASPSLGSTAALFTSITVFHYGSPAGFCFDTICDGGANDPVQDDPTLEGYNVDERTDLFLAEIVAIAQAYQGENVMIMLGGDFQYTNAQRNFKEYEKLIKYANQKAAGKVVFRFSTPSEYTAAKLAESLTFPVKQDDFFPYADAPHQYWVGFFTSRPLLKRYIREASGFLAGARQVSVFSGAGSSTDGLWRAVSIAQHHDAVTGTEMQHVAYDYAFKLSRGWGEAQDGLGQGLSSLITNQGGVQVQLQDCLLRNESLCAPTQSLADGEALLVLLYNPLAHSRVELVSLPVERQDLAVLDGAGQQVQSMVVQNQEWTREQEKRRRWAEEEDRARRDLDVASDEQPVASQFLNDTPSQFLLYFLAEMKPMTVESYFLAQGGGDKAAPSTPATTESPSVPSGSPITIQNDQVLLTFSPSSGLLIGYTDLTVTPVLSYSLSQSFLYYQSFLDPTGEQENAGAYVSRFMNNNTAIPITPDDGGDSPSATLTLGVQGPLIWEVHQTFSSWVSQTIRLTANSSLVEFEWTIGPVPLLDEDGVERGKEVISRFDTSPSPEFPNAYSLDNSGLWYTDSNGREFLERQRDFRKTWNMSHEEPVASNYVPVNSVAYMNDAGVNGGVASTQLTLFPDRSSGCASLTNTSFELMLHRRLIGDDNKGVHEPLNETVGGITPYPDPVRIGQGITVKGKTFLLLQNTASSSQPSASFAQEYRSVQSRIYYPPLLQFSPLTISIPVYLQSHNSSLTLSSELPTNLDVITLQPWVNNTVLLRLAHQFALSEDPVLSQPVTLDLNTLFPSFSITAVQEWSLTANQKIDEWVEERTEYARHLKNRAQGREGRLTKKKTKKHSTKFHTAARLPDSPTVVTISAMEVRTFQLTLASRY